MFSIHGIVADMKTSKFWRKVSFIVLGVYLGIPFLYTMFLASTDNLYLTFFGERASMTIWEGFTIIYAGWFMVTGVFFGVAVLVTSIIGIVRWYRSRKSMQE